MAKFVKDGKQLICPNCGNENLIGRTFFDFNINITRVSYECHICGISFSEKDAKKIEGNKAGLIIKPWKESK